MRVALIHDWLLGMRGGERCLEIIQNLYPDSEIFTLFYDEQGVSQQIRQSKVHCSSLGKLPLVRKYYRYLLAFYPFAARNLSKQLAVAHQERPFDLVISVSHCAAKNVVVPVGVAHLCYCLTPVRYLWDQYDAYFQGRWYEPLTRIVAYWFRRWDVRQAAGVSAFVAISGFVAKRIERYYRRSASVIYPPIDTRLFCHDPQLNPVTDKEQEATFLCVNALVPYKNTHVIVEAFSSLPYKLLVVGQGPELARLKKLAGSNVEFLGKVPLDELRKLYNTSKALVFAAEEDFGMTPLEIQASGRPVIAFAGGGVLETVDSQSTGVFFNELSSQALVEAIESFMIRQRAFTVDNCLKQAQKFSVERFMREFVQAVDELCSLEVETTGGQKSFSQASE